MCEKTMVPGYPDNILESQEGKTEIIADPAMLSHIITELMRPVMQTIGKMLENNTAALEQLSSAQSIQNDRLEALEKQIRLQTPVTSKQVTYMNDAIRQRARALLDKKGIDDKKRQQSSETPSERPCFQGMGYPACGRFRSMNTALQCRRLKYGAMF